MDQRRVLTQRKREKKKAKRKKQLTQKRLRYEEYRNREFISCIPLVYPSVPPLARSEEDEERLTTLKTWYKARARKDRIALEMRANPNWMSEGF